MKARQAWAWAAPLWHFAVGQTIPSNPSAEDFLIRRHASATILNDHLYIVGGMFSRLVDGKVALRGDDAKWPLNETLSLSLKESWVNSTVQFKALEQEAPTFSKATLWRSPDQKSAYWWGGHVYDRSSVPAKDLWQFMADDNGGGTWQRARMANADFLAQWPRTTGASAAVCRGKALYLGGFQSRLTDNSYKEEGRLPIPELATYDMETRTWANTSAMPGFSEFGASVYGAAACAENFGSRGVFFSIGGNVAYRAFADDKSNQMIDTSVLHFYDVASNAWHEQETSGDDRPSARDRHCVVGVQGPNGTYEIYVYGGNDWNEGSEKIKNDIWVLSLPGFVWFRADVESPYRSSHACIANNRQMIVVGGSADPIGPNYTQPDEWAQGLGVFDLTTLSWKDRYDADAGPYEPPQVVTDWYKEGNLLKVNWTDNKVKSLFTNSSNEDNESSASPPAGPADEVADTTSGPIFGGVVGGLLGLGLVAGAVWFLLRWWRRRPRAPAEPTPLLSGPGLLGGGDQSGTYDPNVSQNYQHYAIELNNSEPDSLVKQLPATSPKPHHLVVHGVPQELIVTERPQEMVVTERPQELVVENRPQELPAWR